MNLVLRLLGILVVAFILAPLVIVVPMSFSSASSLQFPPPGYGLAYYKAYFNDPKWLVPTLNSIIIATGTMVLTMILVVPATFALVRHKFSGKGFADLMMLMPLAVPHIVMAIGYYSYFGDLGIVHSHIGVILAHSCLSVPIAFLVLSANLKGFDRTLERAAQSLGATPSRTFIHVTLPILRPGLMISALFAFIQSFDETVVAIFISGRDAQTLPRKMFDSIREQADPVIAVISTLLFVIVLAAAGLPLLTKAIRERRQARALANAAGLSAPH
ncbi:ABC transporter permease [Rhizobium sp. SSA_523]|uniref:ABC transporter permease n=1 Tax=Rhizobium sp. SSA_523 TaxID=2952477 RepID=UPI00209097B6|nr:ABC transporter permease [Rhizobium sp. SSA_523]MCO5732187.1 ABC transporter permease [Rhizobium sp. SSA_523]WKC21398.1 ABC transporter permease [Rhizobium sp. SSA_523]